MFDVVEEDLDPRKIRFRRMFALIFDYLSQTDYITCPRGAVGFHKGKSEGISVGQCAVKEMILRLKTYCWLF